MGRARSARGRNTRSRSAGPGRRTSPHDDRQPLHANPPAGPAAPAAPAAQVAAAGPPAPAGTAPFQGEAALPVAAPSAAAGSAGPGRQIIQVDLWSVAATSALVCLGLGVCLAVAVMLTWTGLSLLDPGAGAGPSLKWGLAFLTVTLPLEVGLGTALATCAACLYNLASRLTGGVQVTVHGSAQPSGAEVRILPAYRRLHAVLRRSAAVRLCSATSADVQGRPVAGAREAER
ncbi:MULTISPECIES: DUF3566 domain-containing protein [Streptomyces]|uniref:DUF3566 domain-containing protein n=1 Tax=Streptomyces lasalocidi TaxID=324833 RepID=A0A4U5WPS3_STRLS|nr:DUF3566 domain-containing protein [Streptomyces lasalocidi]TKT03662.1 hypothetical protein E4U91_28755 [Streptomyces lasalocidi]